MQRAAWSRRSSTDRPRPTPAAAALRPTAGTLRVDLLEEQSLEKDLVRLFGEDFVERLQTAHEAFGDALGVTKKAQRPVAIVLTEPLRKLADAISIG
jgi:hypothetical protein